jgi:uncharacterized membrane protein YbhN (UPF0104 family)
MRAIRHPAVWLPISALLLGFVVWRSRPWELAAVQGIDPLPLLAALALDVPVVLLWAVRSRLLMTRVGHPLSTRELLPVVSFANTINNLTPASSGEVLRALILRDRYGVPYRHSAAVIVVERLWAIWIFGLVGVSASAWTLLAWPPPAAALLGVAAAAACFLPSFAYHAGVRPGPLLRRLAAGRDPAGRLVRLTAGVAHVDDALERILGDSRTSIAFVATTLGVAVCFAAHLALALLALGRWVDPWAALAITMLGVLAGVASALPFGLGAADAVMAVLLSATGVDAARAGAAVLLVRMIQTLPLGIAGTLSWLHLTGGRLPAEAETAVAMAGQDRGEATPPR